MKNQLTAGLRRATTTFQSFSAGQKAVTIVAIVALAVGGYFFSTWAATPSYSPLFSNLASSDAAAIVDKLDSDGVQYQLEDGGNTILVPKDQVYSLRLKMSGEGLPADTEGGGYSILDNQNVMTSEFMQQVGYRRALEGELSKTIKSIDGVNAATVHLAIPQKDVFSDDQQKPTASVLVATGTGKDLKDDQVQAVVHLVASSVEGLDPANVTVVGADGTVLSGSGTATGGGATGDSRSRATTDYEGRLNSSVQRMLDQALGTGNAVVQISVDLDFDNTETKTQKYVADPSAPPLAETTKTEKYSGGGGTPTGGVLGPDNIQVPAGTGSAASGGSGAYEQSESTKNNAVGMVTEVRKSAPGAVKKLSVAVMINSDAVQGANEAQLQQLISSAVGLDANRGDTIAVSAMSFDKTGAQAVKKELADAQAADKQAATMAMIKTGSLIFGVVVLILMAFIGNKRRQKKMQKALQAQIDRFEAEQAELTGAKVPVAIGAGAGAAGELTAGPAVELDPEVLAREERSREITALAAQQPDEVVTLLRGWLADRRG